MPEKTKQTDCKSLAENQEETKDTGNWSEDQREKSYYYDDSYGYEIYNPDDDDDEELE